MTRDCASRHKAQKIPDQPFVPSAPCIGCQHTCIWSEPQGAGGGSVHYVSLSKKNPESGQNYFPIVVNK
jgi:hypothetical protein